MTLRLRFRGTVATRAEASAKLVSPGDAVLVERGRPRLLLLSCPCGCGEHFPINLDSRAGAAWTLYRQRGRGLSLFPSVWRETGCLSHFVIWSNRIFLWGRRDEDFDSPALVEKTPRLVDAVRRHLPKDGLLLSFFELAGLLDAVPWDVLAACRRLVRSGLAREGEGKQRGSFGHTR